MESVTRMWCERIIRNVVSVEPMELPNGNIEYVDLDWRQLGSMLKGRTMGGEEIRVALPDGQSLSHGDVIYEDDTRTVVIRVKSIPVLVARPTTGDLAMRLCLELGNLHCPTSMNDLEFVFPEEPGALELLQQLDIPHVREMRRFVPIKLTSLPRAQLSKDFNMIRGRARADGSRNQTGRCSSAMLDSFKSPPRSSARSI